MKERGKSDDDKHRRTLIFHVLSYGYILTFHVDEIDGTKWQKLNR